MKNEFHHDQRFQPEKFSKIKQVSSFRTVLTFKINPLEFDFLLADNFFVECSTFNAIRLCLPIDSGKRQYHLYFDEFLNKTKKQFNFILHLSNVEIFSNWIQFLIKYLTVINLSVNYFHCFFLCSHVFLIDFLTFVQLVVLRRVFILNDIHPIKSLLKIKINFRVIWIYMLSLSLSLSLSLADYPSVYVCVCVCMSSLSLFSFCNRFVRQTNICVGKGE